MINSKSIHIASFLPGQRAHGGVKRSKQLMFLAEVEGRLVVEYPVTPKEAIRVLWEAPGSWIPGFLHSLSLIRHISLRGIAPLILYAIWIHQVIRLYRPKEVHIEISSNQNMLMGYMLASIGVPYIAYPHNIEFMVPGQRQNYFRSELSAFFVEMSIYRKAHTVKTISDFDNTVLCCFGVNPVETLPYHPTGKDHAELLNIRHMRETSSKQGILILGTVGNAPTHMGIMRLLELISSSGCQRNFRLAGFGTEGLAALAPSCVEVLGSVNPDELRRLLIECQALLVCQTPTTGMLTRIIESHIAGIPTYVTGGYLQAIGLSAQGVFIIDSLADLPSVDKHESV